MQNQPQEQDPNARPNQKAQMDQSPDRARIKVPVHSKRTECIQSPIRSTQTGQNQQGKTNRKPETSKCVDKRITKRHKPPPTHPFQIQQCQRTKNRPGPWRSRAKAAAYTTAPKSSQRSFYSFLTWREQSKSSDGKMPHCQARQLATP